MKPYISGVLTAMLLLAFTPAQAEEAAPQGTTYVIPVKDMIERALVYVIRRGLRQAAQHGADAIILEFDTPGGKLQSTQIIVNMLLHTPTTTYAYVNPRAISAGAILAMATDHIYMAPGSLIGDAMPILSSPLPMGGAQEVPDGLKEKVFSPTLALIRAAAQEKQHDERLAEAMVSPEVEYRIGDDIISEKGKLLTLTSQEAARLVGKEQRPLLSEGTAKSLQDLLVMIGREGSTIVRLETTPTERIARLIEGFPLSGILLALGMLGLYIELKTPGFGIPGIAGILLLAIWFWGHQIAGLAGVGELLLFGLGAILLLLEIFVIPGFGIAGISGIVLMIAAFIMAMVQHYPSAPLYDLPDWQIHASVRDMGIALLLVLIMGAMAARFLPKTQAYKHLMLAASVSGAQGYRASEDMSPLVGRRGNALTPLHPAGLGRFENQRLNVVSRGEYIDRNEPIVIAETHGNRIIVEREPTGSPPAANNNA